MKERKIEDELGKRILVLDGAMGTMIQRCGLDENDFRGERFKSHSTNLKGLNDILNLVRADIIHDIHRKYLDAGADIIETNTFNSTSISLSDYRLENLVYEINKAGAEIARKAVDEIMQMFPERICYVAGAIGPTNKTASMSPDVNNPGFRAVSYDDLFKAYREQVEGLIDGGVDLILIETVFDTLNAKAALAACQEEFRFRGKSIPIMLSATIADKSGRTLSGQIIDAFVASFSQAKLLSIGLNCSLGAEQIEPYLSTLSKVSPSFISVYPNAGLPNHFGNYDQSPEEMAYYIHSFAVDGLVNIVGGCCGTTPEHIYAISESIRGIMPRKLNNVTKETVISGLEPLYIDSSRNFVNIGERTNISGSRRFARLIRDKKYEEALSIALNQVENGAQVIDVNLDDGMLDAKKEMTIFLNYIASDPEIARVPIMIDSSDWDVIEAGLKCVQGKAIVNSISLKDGEEKFIEKAHKIMSYGAAVVVMAFDEHGQAIDYETKINICKRAYDLLIEIGFPAQDIIFDCNILTIATGIIEHNNYALDFINAVKWVKENLPYCKTSGGISNLSFSFRGNDLLRESMHSVFLYYAIRSGLDMGIVNAGQLPILDDIDPNFRKLLEDVILNRRKNAIERLVKYADSIQNNSTEQNKDVTWREKPVNERIIHSLLKGNPNYIVEDIEEARKLSLNSLSLIEGPLMKGMDIVGNKFGEGKMFLPQVIKSARVMKKAVSYLMPFIELEKVGNVSCFAGKIVIATVKGDVHDIGKNIAGVVLACNNFKVIDLGVMVSKEVIVDSVIANNADIVGLSGLITPSLEEMISVVKEFELRGIMIPIMISGATTSEIHTALKIVPNYSGPIIYIKDASQGVKVASALMSSNRDIFLNGLEKKHKQIIEKYNIQKSSKGYISLEDARKKKVSIDWNHVSISHPKHLGKHVYKDITLTKLVELINWSFFFKEWEINGKWPEIASDIVVGDQVKDLFEDAKKILNEIISEKLIIVQAVYGIWKAAAIEERVELYLENGEVITTFNFLRNQEQEQEINYCLSDYIAPKHFDKEDFMGVFTVIAKIDEEKINSSNKYDDYDIFIIRTLANRFAEAASQFVHYQIRNYDWGYVDEKFNPDLIKKGTYKGIRPAPGYSTCPDHSEKVKILEILDACNVLGLDLTENFMIYPTASICGYYFANPQAIYFNVGKVSKDQILVYAKNKELDVKIIEKYLQQNLNY